MKYVQCIHIAPIKCRLKDTQEEFAFGIEQIEKYTGKKLHTGYTPVTEENLKRLEAQSRTFVHFRDKEKLLIVYNELPDEAKTVYETVAEYRAQFVEMQKTITEKDKVIMEHNNKIEELEKTVTELSKTASKSLTEKVETLQKANEKLEKQVAEDAETINELQEKITTLEKAPGQKTEF